MTVDGNTLALIEVRYRSDATFGAAASITRRTQRRTTAAARHLLLATHGDLRRHPARFDVMALAPDAEGRLQLDWIKGAFAA